MNILQIGSYLEPDLVGGAEISASNVRAHLMTAGHRVLRLRWRMGQPSLRARLREEAPAEWAAQTWRPSAPAEKRSTGGKLLFYMMEFASSWDAEDFNAMLAAERIDLIIVHSFKGLGYDVLKKITGSKVPVIFFLHDFTLICMIGGMIYRRRACDKLCTFCSAVAQQSREALQLADRYALVGPSRYIVDRVGATLGVSPERLHHIPNANKYNLTPRVRATQGRPLVIGYVGRLEEEKGVRKLLEVVDKLSADYPLEFITAGAGSLDHELQQFVESRKWAQYLGYVEQRNMHEVYDRIDVMVVPSLWPENFPGVAVQSITSGAAVVAFDTGGIREIVTDHENGRLLPLGDFDGIEQALRSVLEDGELLRRYSETAIESAQRFDPTVLSKRLLALVDHVGGSARAA